MQYQTIDNLGSNENAFLHSLENSKISSFLRNCKQFSRCWQQPSFCHKSVPKTTVLQKYGAFVSIFRFFGDFFTRFVNIGKMWKIIMSRISASFFLFFCQQFLAKWKVCLSHSFKKRDLCCKNVKTIFLFQPRGPCETEQIMEAAEEDLTILRKGGRVVRMTLRSLLHRFI